MKPTFLMIGSLAILISCNQDADYKRKENAILEKTESLKKAEDFFSAAKTFQQLEEININQPTDYYFNLGELYFLDEDYPNAKKYFRKYLIYADNNPTLIKKCIGFINKMRNDSIALDVISKIKHHPLNNDHVFEYFQCTKKPVFPGGEKELINYIYKNTRYPTQAIEQAIEGTVYIKFVIKKTGEISQTFVLRAVDPDSEKEALRVVNSFPKWSPAKIKGTPVNCWYIVPIKFILQ
jgi:TonB family protein